MFRCGLQKFSLILMVSLLSVSWNAEGAVGQEKGKAGESQSSQPSKKQKNSRAKKKPAPFRWVNSLPTSAAKTLGLQHGTFKSPSLNKKVGYCIYLPADYSRSEGSEKRYPVVYYLHGGRPGNELKSIKLAAEIDKAMSQQNVAPMIYVFVNGGPVSHYNMPDDPSAQGADVFINELIPHIDSTYRTIADRGGRGIEGFSQGGRGTARLMFRHPELFCSASPGGGGHATEKKISESGGQESANLIFAKGDNTWDLTAVYLDKLKSVPDLTPLNILVHVGNQGFNY
ncbi:MAG: alpha/beta hydrolase-fold protein, partial [Mariniblastus sp.]|nr:alpha/beta hydrolase-fold protein [Mariniblastus sp.]